MQSLQDRLAEKRFSKPQTKSGILGPRHEMIVKFTDRINEQRTSEGWGKLPYPAVAKKIKHVPTSQLYSFYQQCENARHFTKYFFWSLKV